MQVTQTKTSKLVRGSAMMVALGLIATATVQAAPIRVSATEDAAQPGFFTLDFGGEVGTSSGQISSTDYGLEIDPDAGTSRLVDYYQQVESLNLFGVPTGDITVEVVEGSSVGTYNKATREFTTTEMYRIHFTADLSAFGLFSPVVLPSTSTGTVDIANGGSNSHVNLTWEGTSDVIPGQEFAYTCQVNTTFTSSALQLVDLGLKSSVLELTLAQKVENQLISRLDMATLRLEQRNTSSAARNLTLFVNDVKGFRSQGSISVFSANALIADAEDVIFKLTAPKRRFRTK